MAEQDDREIINDIFQSMQESTHRYVEVSYEIHLLEALNNVISLKIKEQERERCKVTDNLYLYNEMLREMDKSTYFKKRSNLEKLDAFVSDLCQKSCIMEANIINTILDESMSKGKKILDDAQAKNYAQTQEIFYLDEIK